ncbi:hypothetical protein B0H17DRAFT_1212410 [Mycena rosella]|uniref:Uncharacterized protein n=1 Tax=Mycena rosella TaxID=1033263 RepID=A0AAD7CVX9_MYCRO|nr:hypothetical protein B0H17DRAFT_1212410 [Mycena rosella]
MGSISAVIFARSHLDTTTSLALEDSLDSRILEHYSASTSARATLMSLFAEQTVLFVCLILHSRIGGAYGDADRAQCRMLCSQNSLPNPNTRYLGAGILRLRPTLRAPSRLASKFVDFWTTLWRPPPAARRHPSMSRSSSLFLRCPAFALLRPLRTPTALCCIQGSNRGARAQDSPPVYADGRQARADSWSSEGGMRMVAGVDVWRICHKYGAGAHRYGLRPTPSTSTLRSRVDLIRRLSAVFSRVRDASLACPALSPDLENSEYL